MSRLSSSHWAVLVDLADWINWVINNAFRLQTGLQSYLDNMSTIQTRSFLDQSIFDWVYLA